MFHPGDIVSYGTNGVCEITEQKRVQAGGAALRLPDLKAGLRCQSMTICVPCDQRKCCWTACARCPPRRNCWQCSTSLPPPTSADADARKLSSTVEALQSGDLPSRCCGWCGISAPNKPCAAAKGKQLSAYEDSALRDAQNVLHSEFAYVMGIEPNEVPKFIAKELGE